MLGIVGSLWAGWWTWWVGLVGGVGTPVGGRSRLPQPPCFHPPSGLPVPGHWRSWLHQEGAINTLSSLGRTTWSRYWQSLARLGWFGSWEKLTRSYWKDATDRDGQGQVAVVVVRPFVWHTQVHPISATNKHSPWWKLHLHHMCLLWGCNPTAIFYAMLLLTARVLWIQMVQQLGLW